MSQTELQRFVKSIETDHVLATGLKIQSNHHDIVQFATSQGFNFSLSAWIRFCWLDQLQLTDNDLELIWTTKNDHWSWAFRQIAAWRALLMDGANQDSSMDSTVIASTPVANTAVANTAVDDKDKLLEDFIALARQDQSLQQKIRDARNDTEILEIANSHGFAIDSMTLLKKWSQHTDFSKPTWQGWFE